MNDITEQGPMISALVMACEKLMLLTRLAEVEGQLRKLQTGIRTALNNHASP